MISTNVWAKRESGLKRRVSRCTRTGVNGTSGRDVRCGQVSPRMTNSSTMAMPALAWTSAHATEVNRTMVLTRTADLPCDKGVRH